MTHESEAPVRACEHEWSVWEIIEYTGDWFHPHIVKRKCKRCGEEETDEH